MPGDEHALRLHFKPLLMASKLAAALLKDPYVRPRVKSIVAFGSATTPAEFVERLSDIDVLMLVDRKSKRLVRHVQKLASSINPSISPTVFSCRGFVRMLKTGSPSALLMLEGVVLYDTGDFSRARRAGFKPTERTIKTSIDHAFRALSIAFNDYFSGFDLPEAINCAYHCARHALRAVVVKKTGILPGSNEQLMRNLKYSTLREALGELIRARSNAAKLMGRYSERRASSSDTTLRDDIGVLLLCAERVASESCEICLRRKVRDLRKLLIAADRKFKGCKILAVSWERWRWEVMVEHEGRIKHLARVGK